MYNLACRYRGRPVAVTDCHGRVYRRVESEMNLTPTLLLNTRS
jgi:hypothetical protein